MTNPAAAVALSDREIARIIHEANRALQKILADPAIPVASMWEYVDTATQAGVIAGVKSAREGISPEKSHANWCESKLADGWTYGETKDQFVKTHPCLVPYDELPASSQIKDHLFLAIVGALTA